MTDSAIDGSGDPRDSAFDPSLFELDVGDVLREIDPDKDFPYWTVKERLYNVDEHKLTYRLQWMHPDSWEMEFEVLTEPTTMAHFDRVDDAEAEQRAREVAGLD